MAKFDDLSWYAGADDFPDDVLEENGAIDIFLTWATGKGLLCGSGNRAWRDDLIRHQRTVRKFTSMTCLICPADARICLEIRYDQC
ncbi:MAG: hypothetical protein AB7F22_02985 [Reyranella sp.]|uniref:hypothetical protein n=1 Tax=Reyranella sp. TaxID=1929291 RepID=UPI003D0CB666